MGAAGQLLEEMLGSIGWQRPDVFITNVVKCRPPGNRDPEPTRSVPAAPYLDRQEQALDPVLIVTLGRHSLQRYLPGARISEAHGRLRRRAAGLCCRCTIPLPRSGPRPCASMAGTSGPAGRAAGGPWGLAAEQAEPGRQNRTRWVPASRWGWARRRCRRRMTTINR